MNYVKYNRSFVMLEEQSSEFSARSTPIKGHLKVETGNNKGALRCAVQNLRYYDKGEYIYKLILFGTKNERTIHTIIGNLLVNRQGNGETYFRFQPLDIDGKGNQYHDYSAAIIAAVSTVDERESLHPVLRGTILSDAEPFKYEQKDLSAASLRDNKEDEEEQAQSQGGESGTDQDEMKGNIPDGIEEKQDTQQQHWREEKQDTQQQHWKEEKQAIQQHDLKEQGNHEKAENMEKSGRDQPNKLVHVKNYNHFYNKYVLTACTHTCRVAEFYEDVKPFDLDKTGAVWKKIVNVGSLPLVSPGAHYFATQYRHFIFGAKADQDGNAAKFYFGIPGRFLNEEQPDGGESGFSYWQPIKGMNAPIGGTEQQRIQAQKMAYGYWIVEIDGKTGDILGL